MYVIRKMEACTLYAYIQEDFYLYSASDPGVTMKAKGGHNTADHYCLTADNHSKGRSLSQLAFEACVNHTYHVRQTDCLCSTDIQCFTVISVTQYGAQLDLYSFKCLSLPKFFACVLY